MLERVYLPIQKNVLIVQKESPVNIYKIQAILKQFYYTRTLHN